MVTAYYGKKMGKTLRIELFPYFLCIQREIWHTCWVYGVVVRNTFFDSGGKCVAMATAYCGKKHFQIKFGTHVGLEVLVHDTFF